MTFPLGYDTDPATRGEGSSTGRRRRASECDESDSPPRKRRTRRYDAEDDNDYQPPGARAPTSGLKLILRLPVVTPSSAVLTAPPPMVGLPLPPTPSTSASPTPTLPRIRLLVGGGRPRKTKRGGGGNSDAVPRASRSSRSTRSRRTSATPTTLESIAAESHAIKAECTRLGLVLRDVTADGNCLFRALADQVWGEQSRHAEVRTLVCNHLDQARGELGDFVAGFLNEGEDYGAYVSRMRGMGIYGSHIELLAATKVFRRSIRIVLAQTSYTVEYVESEGGDEDAATAPTTATRKTRREKKAADDDETLAPTDVTPTFTPIPPPLPGCSFIWLALFAEAEHYESVRKGGAGGPAEVPDTLAVPHARDVSEAARRERGEVIEGDAKDTKDKANKVDSRLAQVLASLRAGHSVTTARATGVLARTKGDIGAAVEILLEDLEAEAEDATSDASAGTSATASTLSRPSASVSESASAASAADRVEAMLEPNTEDTGRVTRSRSSHSSRANSKVDVHAYRDRPSSPSSSEASDPSTPPTSPLSHASEVEVDDKGPVTRSKIARGRGRGKGRARGGARGRASKM